MSWLVLYLAGGLEILWAVGLKAAAGFTRPGATAVAAVAYVASFVLLARAVQTLPVGTAYAVWTGIGAAGTAVVGMILWGEPRNAGRLVCIGLIIAGIVGLRLLDRRLQP